MDCDIHVLTELVIRDGGTQMEDGKICGVQIYSCPRCKKDKYKKILTDPPKIEKMK